MSSKNNLQLSESTIKKFDKYGFSQEISDFCKILMVAYTERNLYINLDKRLVLNFLIIYLKIIILTIYHKIHYLYMHQYLNLINLVIKFNGSML